MRAALPAAVRRTWPDAPARLWTTIALSWEKGVLKKGMVLRLSGFDVEYLSVIIFLVGRRAWSSNDDFYCVGDVVSGGLGDPRLVPFDAEMLAVPFYMKADRAGRPERITLVHPKV